jgi:hypothetical protein
MNEDKRLLTPGWGGTITLEEARFIKKRLEADKRLRKRWGFKGDGRVSLLRIAEIAMDGTKEDRAEARRLMDLQIQKERRAKHDARNK